MSFVYEQALMEGQDLFISDSRFCGVALGNAFSNRHCDENFACGICSLPARGTLKLKGLCREDVEYDRVYDIDYYVHGQMNGHPHFRYAKCFNSRYNGMPHSSRRLSEAS